MYLIKTESVGNKSIIFFEKKCNSHARFRTSLHLRSRLTIKNICKDNMRTIKIFQIMGCALAAAALVGCDPTVEQPEQKITAEQKIQAYNTIKGNYTGFLIYGDPEATGVTTDVTDSVAINWTVATDSSIVIKDLPGKPFANHLKGNDEMLAALKNASAAELKLIYGFFNVSPIGFFVNPSSPAFNLNYGGGAHKVQLAFYVNNAYSFGAFNATENQMQAQMVLGGVYVDGQLEPTLVNAPVAYVISGKKK